MIDVIGLIDFLRTAADMLQALVEASSLSSLPNPPDQNFPPTSSNSPSTQPTTTTLK